MDITQVKGFDQSIYNQLVQDAQDKYISRDTVDKQIKAAMDAGKSFGDAITQVRNELPSLPPPMTHGGTLKDSPIFTTALPSFGAQAMALIGDVSEQSRKAAKDIRNQKTEQIIDQMQEEAKTFKSQATMQLFMGIATGLVQIGQGLTSLGMMAKGIKANNAEYNKNLAGGMDKATADAQRTTAEMKLNNTVSSVNTTIGGLTSVLNGVSSQQNSLYEAQRKEMDAKIEGMRDFRDTMKDLEDAMKAIVSKTRDTMSAIQQSSIQAKTRIMTHV